MKLLEKGFLAYTLLIYVLVEKIIKTYFFLRDIKTEKDKLLFDVYSVENVKKLEDGQKPATFDKPSTQEDSQEGKK